MSDKVGILVIHGIGSQDADFSVALRNEVSNRLEDSKTRFVWKAIYWADILKKREDAMWSAMQNARDEDGDRLDLDWRNIREFIIHNLGDAVAYQKDLRQSETAYQLIHERVSSSITDLKALLGDESAPIVVMAHSLGAHIMSNYIWDRQTRKPDTLESLPNLLSMITFGCNIPLFSLAFEKPLPINLPGEGITDAALKNVSKWINFFDRDDVLGWPLKALYESNIADMDSHQKSTVNRITDKEINVGSLLIQWNPAAHNEYWTDNDMTLPITEYLQELIKALDK